LTAQAVVEVRDCKFKSETSPRTNQQFGKRKGIRAARHRD